MLQLCMVTSERMSLLVFWGHTKETHKTCVWAEDVAQLGEGLPHRHEALDPIP